MKKIAVLITCFNRRSITLECLNALFQNTLPEKYSLKVFLVDDASSDGTEKAIRHIYPNVQVIKGNGNLYWNGGMRIAFDAGMQTGSDYYLWLNDDTFLYSSAIQMMISTSEGLEAKLGKSAIVVGSTRDAKTGQFTYGGVIRPNKFKPVSFSHVIPQDAPVECETMNGNCVLITSEIAKVVGSLDSGFIHAMGDLDYGLRARKSGFSVWIMPGYAGTCSHNDPAGSFNDPGVPIIPRLRKMMQPKGLPFASWRIFTRRHAGILWPVYWLWPYVKVVLKGQLNR